MKGIQIYLADENYDGAITMSSTASQITATRVSKETVSDFDNELNGPGIYLLLVGSNSVYVGQTGLDTINKRIMNTHSGSIDSSWHTVVGFRFANKTISSNELQYIENAMCEYAHNEFEQCLTTSPAKGKCNATFRNQHYNLSSGQIQSCKQYIKDIQYYISMFPKTIFPTKYQKKQPVLPKNTEIFYFKNKKRDVEGTALIGIKLGHTDARVAVLQKGSKISPDVSTSFRGYQSIISKRKQLEAAGKIVDRVLQEDITFPSQSGAGQFLNGTSFDGNGNWKTVKDGTKLKDLL